MKSDNLKLTRPALTEDECQQFAAALRSIGIRVLDPDESEKLIALEEARHAPKH